MRILSRKGLLCLCLCLCFFAYCPTGAQASEASSFDYSVPGHWISAPEQTTAHAVDVFYVYPTVDFADVPENMDITDERLSEAAKGVVMEHTGVFKKTANVFAPFYRQVSIAVLSLSPAEFDRYFPKAYGDVKNAFLYYLAHQNKGRPFILAGHSQGSLMIMELMKELFGKESLMDQLVAAYIIGYSVTPADLEKAPWMKIARTETDTGVFITYNTQSKNATGSPVLLPGAMCVNPLTWTTRNEPGDAALNQGAVFFDENHGISREVPGYTSAYIADSGALIAPEPVPEDFHGPASFFPLGVYHAYDYSFFYRNLETNAARRVQAYLKQK